MLTTISNLLKGQVTGRVESGFPERVLNLCGEYGLSFWNIQWESPVSFVITLSRRDWKQLRRLTRRMDCQLTALGWRGTPFFLGRIRYRYGLWITFLACSLALFYGSFFIWDFEITGNETVSEQEILRAMESCGIRFGTFGYSVNSFQMRNDILLELPELSYIAINVRGCRAYVQVRERIDAPKILRKQEAGNTVASKDALVTAIQPWDGEKQVLPGTTVQKGQLLISGVVENDYGGTRYLRGMGKVYGRTWYELRCSVPITIQKKVYTGEKRTKRAILIGKKRLNLYVGSRNSDENCDIIKTWNKWELPGGIALPVTTATERYYAYTTVETERTRSSALALGEQILLQRLRNDMEEGQVLSYQITGETVGSSLLVTLTAECQEEIGTFVEIPKE